jgi:hypothetical protein
VVDYPVSPAYILAIETNQRQHTMFDHASNLPTVSATERAVSAIDWQDLANYTRACADKRKSEAHMAYWLELKAASRAAR